MLCYGGIYALVFRQHRQRQMVWVVLLGYQAFAFIDWGWLKRGTDIYTYTHGLHNALLAELGSRYLYQLVHEMRVAHLENHSLFLASSGIVMYFSGTMLFYVFVKCFAAAADALGQRVIFMLISLVNLLQLNLPTLVFYGTSQPPLLPFARSHE
jgi:hypothetical protein